MHSPESPPQVTPISEEVDNTSDSEASPIPARPEWDAPTVMAPVIDYGTERPPTPELDGSDTETSDETLPEGSTVMSTPASDTHTHVHIPAKPREYSPDPPPLSPSRKRRRKHSSVQRSRSGLDYDFDAPFEVGFDTQSKKRKAQKQRSRSPTKKKKPIRRKSEPIKPNSTPSTPRRKNIKQPDYEFDSTNEEEPDIQPMESDLVPEDSSVPEILQDQQLEQQQYRQHRDTVMEQSLRRKTFATAPADKTLYELAQWTSGCNPPPYLFSWPFFFFPLAKQPNSTVPPSEIVWSESQKKEFESKLGSSEKPVPELLGECQAVLKDAKQKRKQDNSTRPSATSTEHKEATQELSQPPSEEKSECTQEQNMPPAAGVLVEAVQASTNEGTLLPKFVRKQSSHYL